MAIEFGRRRVLLGLVTLIPLALGILFFLEGSLRQRPTAEEFFALAQANRFDEAQAVGTDYLRRAARRFERPSGDGRDRFGPPCTRSTSGP